MQIFTKLRKKGSDTEAGRAKQRQAKNPFKNGKALFNFQNKIMLKSICLFICMLFDYADYLIGFFKTTTLGTREELLFLFIHVKC